MFFDIISYMVERMLVLSLQLSRGSYPKPLSRADESDCFLRMRSGDRSARDLLIRHNLRLVAHVLKKYNTSCDPDDLLSIGTIGLIKAVDSFDPQKNVRFATYAAKCIENEILMHLRSAKRSGGTLYINDPLDTDAEGNSLTILDLLSDDSDLEGDIELKSSVAELRRVVESLLIGREKRIIELRFGLGGRSPLTQQQVAVLLGISRSYVSRIETRVIAKLRSELDRLSR